MNLEILPRELSICKLTSLPDFHPGEGFFALCRTDSEISLVCPAEEVPETAAAREDGWRALRVEGALDFSLTGILSRLTAVLADRGIGLFAVSTYDTDDILVRAGDLDRAANALADAGYGIRREI